MTSPSRVQQPSELSTARYVLLNLPAELIFHFWGIALKGDPYESLELIKKVFELVPEISWCLEIVTDEVQHYKLSQSLPQSLRILSLDDYENSLLSSSSSSRAVRKLVRRALVLFNSQGAVDTGELSLEQGCRYSRLLSSGAFDVSYCFVKFRHIYTDELLMHIRCRLPARKAASVHILSMLQGTESEESTTPMKPDSDTCNTRSIPEVSGTDIQYIYTMCQKIPPNSGHIFAPNPCASSTTRCNQFCRSVTIYTTQKLFEGVTRLRIAFKSTLIPLLNIPSSVNSLPDGDADSLFSLANLNWSFERPQGSILCKHTATNPLVRDQESYEAFHGNVGPLVFTKAYKSIVYYGISDTSLMDMTVFGGALEELVWYRLSPSVLLDLPPSDRHSHAHAPQLKRLAIFSEVRRAQRDLWHIPCFEGMGFLNHVQLVALEGSDQCWKLDWVLRPKGSLAKVKSLELLQLRKESAPFPYERSQVLHLDLGPVAARLEKLSIGGYLFPAPSTPTPCFRRLKFLCLDVSCGVCLDDVDGIWYTVSLTRKRFPRLKHLYLKGVLGMAYLAVFPRLVLSKTCTQITLSSVFRERFMVNDKELEIPTIPVVPDTFNKWRWSTATTEYTYCGTG